jgi:type IV pilus assembly protein PilQ
MKQVVSTTGRANRLVKLLNAASRGRGFACALCGVLAILSVVTDFCRAQSPLQQLFENVPGWVEGIQPNNAPAGQPTAQPTARQQDAQNVQNGQSGASAIRGIIPPIGGQGVELSEKDGRISLVARNAALSEVVAELARSQHLNIVAANDIDAVISITLHDVPVEEALTAILEVANYTWVRRSNIILITSLVAAANLPADAQNRQIQIFELDFAKATTVASAIEGFLSPIGKASVSSIDPTDNRHSRELVIVEDLPASLARVAAYIHQIDQPPRQVLIEAHILQVSLNDTNEHGVDFRALLRAAGSNVTLKSAALTAPATLPSNVAGSSTGAFLATIEGGDLESVIQCLQSTTDTKTLSSPKLLVLNGQGARVHVGEKIGYQTTVTTEIQSTGQPAFLDVGVTLLITPQITRDGRVMLHVEPKVSTGAFNPESKAPDERTSELRTDIMLNDGQGMIIGGLIKENDSTTQSKIPWLGNVRGLGWFFRQSKRIKERDEIIFALVPRIQPYEPQYQAFEQGELVRAGVPLFHGPLNRTDRPWDPVLPDGRRVSVPLNPRKAINYHRVPPWPPETSSYLIPTQPMPVQNFGDATFPSDSISGPTTAGPFLSDEATPVPRRQPAQSVEIISDQPRQ